MTGGDGSSGPKVGNQIPRTPFHPKPNRNHHLRSGFQYQPVPTPERSRLNVENLEVRRNDLVDNSNNIALTNEINSENNINNSSFNNSSLNSNLQNPNSLNDLSGNLNGLNMASNSLNRASNSLNLTPRNSNSNLDNLRQASNNLRSHQNFKCKSLMPIKDN